MNNYIIKFILTFTLFLFSSINAYAACVTLTETNASVYVYDGAPATCYVFDPLIGGTYKVYYSTNNNMDFLQTDANLSTQTISLGGGPGGGDFVTTVQDINSTQSIQIDAGSINASKYYSIIILYIPSIIAINDNYIVEKGDTLNVNVLTNDLGDDLEILSYATVLVNQDYDTGNGNGILTINGNGELVYTSDSNANGNITFNYTVSNGTDDINATVNITVLDDGDWPETCYGYYYKQNDQYYLTSTPPKITGALDTSPIDLSVYIQNRSDISIPSMSLALENNLTQEDFEDNITTVYNRVTPLEDDEYFFTNFKLTPTIDNATMDLNMSFTISGVKDYLGYSENIPACDTGGGESYNPLLGRFNVVHDKYYTNDMGYKLNIPTQVVKREGNFQVIALDEENSELNVSTIVGIEIVDVSGNAVMACQDPARAISERIWLKFDNNISRIAFNQEALQLSIDNSVNIPIELSSDFYDTASKNAALRISYNVTNDGEEDLVRISEGSPSSNTKIENFTDLVQDVGNCLQAVLSPTGASNNTQLTNKVAVACGNAGGRGISEPHLQACMECLYGINTKYVCSRDNFAIRPEAFLMHIDDQDQSTSANHTRLTTGYTGSIGATATPLNLAAGYNYVLDVNATSHIDNIPTKGYDNNFTTNMLWNTTPLSSADITGCNDTLDKPVNLTFNVGNSDKNASIGQVGEYLFNILDDTWTRVDSNASNLHHYENNNFFAGADCTPDVTTTYINTNYSNLNGCNISSKHITSSTAFANIQYNDYNATIHPYKFDVTDINPTVGLNHSAITTTSFIYMSDMNQSLDENMSYHLNGNIRPSGYNESNLSNFVDGCYAKPLDINLNTSTINTPVAYQYRFHTYELNSSEIGTGLITDLNNTGNPINIVTADFPQDLNGTSSTVLNLNYDRDANNSINPQVITFIDYKVNCTTTSDCTFNADLVNNKETNGTKDLNASIPLEHYFGRTNAPRQRFVGPDGNASIYYEVHCSTNATGVCNKALLTGSTGSTSTDDPRWFKNDIHTTAIHGNVGTVKQRSASGPLTGIVDVTALSGATPEQATLSYDESRDYPYKTTMDNNASTWLIYNKYNINDTTNEFQVEFISAGGDWAGQNETNTTTNSNASQRTNRRSMW